MATVFNPHIAVIIHGAEDWDSDTEKYRLDMDIQVEKDQDGEPNEASVTIYNLNDDTQNRIIDPSQRDTPIEIFFAPFGTDERVSCFIGEIETKRNEQLRPGTATHLVCKSQQWQSRDKCIDSTTFEKGTPITEVIKTLVEIIDLPVNLDLTGFSVDTLLLSETLSGPAFMALRRFMDTYGVGVFICDGVLYFSDVYEAPNPTIVPITNAILTGPIEPTERRDVVDVVLRTIADSTGSDPFATPRKKKRKKRKVTKLARYADKKKVQAIAAEQDRQANLQSDGSYIEYEAVDDTIFGVTAELLGAPTIIPDNIVQFEGSDQYYRVRTVTHAGDTKDGVLTTINCDVYEEDVEQGGAF